MDLGIRNRKAIVCESSRGLGCRRLAASNAPLIVLGTEVMPGEANDRLNLAFIEIGKQISAARPDVIIAIAPDHRVNFYLDNFPTITLGVGDEHDGPPEPKMASFPHKSFAGDPAFGRLFWRPRSLENNLSQARSRPDGDLGKEREHIFLGPGELRISRHTRGQVEGRALRTESKSTPAEFAMGPDERLLQGVPGGAALFGARRRHRLWCHLIWFWSGVLVVLLGTGAHTRCQSRNRSRRAITLMEVTGVPLGAPVRARPV
jgi:hypothetical protein